MIWVDPAQRPEYFLYFQYFQNPRHHKPGIPLDMISYRFCSERAPDATPDVQ
jgi:hypothetical protein